MVGVDWKARAEREAAAILDGMTVHVSSRNDLIPLLAIAWLQGMNLGVHETLADAEQAFERLRESL